MNDEIFKLYVVLLWIIRTIDFSLEPFVSSESIGGSESIITCEAARSGHYVRNCQWKLSTNTALKLFNDNFSAGSRSCWLVREARTQGSKKYARRPREDDPANAGAIFYRVLPELCVPFLDTFDSKCFFFLLFSNSLTTYVRSFMASCQREPNI